MRPLSFILFLMIPFVLFSQDETYSDEKYLEDQIYFGIQYNTLITYGNGIDNYGVPYSFEVGLIKDIPLNKARNLAIGLGFGYSYDVLRPNITITSNNGVIEFDISDEFSSYKYLSHNLEMPLEFRWRTSTPTNDSFWRVYTGASIIYNLSNKSEFNTGTEITSFTDIEAINKVNYTVYTSIGYGKWNFHVKYYLKSPFTDSTRTINDERLNFNQLKMGVLFYIL